MRSVERRRHLAGYATLILPSAWSVDASDVGDKVADIKLKIVALLPLASSHLGNTARHLEHGRGVANLPTDRGSIHPQSECPARGRGAVAT